MSSDRELTRAESKAYNFIKAFERYCDNRRLSAVVFMSGAALEIVQRNNIATPLKVDFNKTKKIYEVTYLMTEFRKYVEYMAEGVGLKVTIDGTVLTWDNQVISNKEDIKNDSD